MHANNIYAKEVARNLFFDDKLKIDTEVINMKFTIETILMEDKMEEFLDK